MNCTACYSGGQFTMMFTGTPPVMIEFALNIIYKQWEDMDL